MGHDVLTDDSCEKIKPRLHRRIGRELRLAGYVFDLGWGACDLVQYLARTYRQQATGVDISGKNVPRRQHAPGDPRFRCIRKNAEHLGLAKDGSRDAVVSTWALHEMKRPRASLKEVHRVLRPGGGILIVDFRRGPLAQRPWNKDCYEPDEVPAYLAEAGFQDIRVRLIERGQIIWAKGFRPPVRGASRHR